MRRNDALSCLVVVAKKCNRARGAPAAGGVRTGASACYLGAVRSISLFLPTLAASAVMSCAGADREPPRGLLLITLDTVRADRLGTFGYGRDTSPRLDAFAREAVVFERAQAPTSWTLASLASLLTSQQLSSTGIRDFRSKLDPAFTTLAELLDRAGFATAVVGTHVVFQAKYGLLQGFDEVDDELVLADFTESHRAITSERVSDKGIAWLEARAGSDEPWFLWLHYFDPHIPYLPHGDLTRRFGGEGSDRYDGEIAYVDAQIGRVLDAVDRLAPDDAVVVLTADHGEEFGDHGAREHGHTLYQELLHVPLVVRAPGFAPRRVPDRVHLVDVLPTLVELLDLAGAPAPADLAGVSLVPALRGHELAQRAFLGELRLRARNAADCLIRGRWKLIVERDPDEPDGAGGRALLFDLERDPRETRDLAGRHPALVRELAAELEARLASARTAGEALRAGGRVDLSREEEQLLEALGYAQGY